MKPLIREQFLQDSRYIAAKKLIQEALADAQKTVDGVRGADSERAITYKQLIERFAQARGNPLFYPYVGSGIGNGPLVELADGSVKYDLISGIGVHYFGHSFAPLIDVAVDGATADIVMQGNLEQNEEALILSERLITLSQLDHCFLTTSGAMACENALKICFQKKEGARRILAFDRCFSGRTLVLSQITDKPEFRVGLPYTLPIDYVPFYDPNNHKKSIQAAKETLLKHIQRYPHQHAAMCLELIQGEGGFYVGNNEFFSELIHILRSNNIAVWIDEVQTFGRTESLFATHYFGLDAVVDVITIGKVAQVCATLFRKEFAPKPGLLSQTFIGSTTAIRTTQMLLEYINQHHFFGKEGRIAKLSKDFFNHLRELIHKHPDTMHGPYGIGLLVAFGVGSGEKKETEAFLQRLFEHGVIAFSCGHNPTRIRMLLPTTLTSNELPEIFHIIEKAL